ncbi:hypothetical protein [Rhodopirellula halodulae]|uniref:hypothetical protein n=1 Tax=Rhodopirellula halodulae TaxID=2894198 RepID=UPI001E5C6941|nr:hypothetical protein [Rhodopirellula sp. JC737]MCC9658787.1 hypothetical protein [Rhodopirellula sp. JC737]
MKRYANAFWLSLLICSIVRAQGESRVTTEQLISTFKANPRLEWPFLDSEPKHQPEAILNVLADRGEAALQPLRELRAEGKANDAKDDAWSLATDLALLTTIRRIEGRSPPLRINVDVDVPIKSAVRKPARIPVKIVNQDPEREPIWFTFGGDYRSGRLSRWRIHVWDDKERRLPAIGPNYGMGGGVYSQGELGFGESDEQTLDLASFVRIRLPGRYTAQVFYHDSVTIADIEDEKKLEELTIVSSNRFTIEITAGPKIRIPLTEAEYDKSRELLSQLKPLGTVKMIGGEYGPRYHSFISPDSAHGKLLAMGRTAVPALILRLKHPDAEYKERAWILAILDSILHERYLSPTDFDGAIDSYRCEFPGGYCSASGSRSNEAQEQLIADWVSFAKEYIVVDKQR